MNTNNIEKFVTFRMGNEQFGVNISQVMSIEKVDQITRLPDLPQHIKGIINLRGNVIPIIDLREFLLKTVVETTINNRVIIVKVDDSIVGLVVDEATDVQDIPADLIQSVSIGGTEVTKYMKVAKLPERLIMIIDIELLISNTDIARALTEVQKLL